MAHSASGKPARGRRLADAAGVCAAAALGYALTANLPLTGDEPHHIAQIRLFMRGNWHLVPTLTTIPGYHALIAAVALLTRTDTLPALRAWSLTLSAAGMLWLWIASPETSGPADRMRALQIAFLPIACPLFFFLYTDVMAALVMGAALLAAVRGRHHLAAFAATGALLIRQNYIVWFAFAAAVSAWHAATSTDARREVSDRRGRVIRATRGYAVGALLFVAFVLVNGGVAIGDRTMHPFPSLTLGNVYFALIVAFVMFLPLHLANLTAIGRYLRRPLVLLVIAAGWPLFLVSFRVDHPYNQPSMSWWLHNALLTWTTSSIWARSLAYAVVVMSALSLRATRLRSWWQYLLYPAAVASAVPAWQIEPRYYILPAALFLAFRRPRGEGVELAMTSYLIALTGVLFAGISRGAWFI